MEIEVFLSVFLQGRSWTLQ